MSLGLVLSGCAGEAGAPEAEAAPPVPAVALAEADNGNAVFDGGAGAASVAASTALFASSPAAVVLAAPNTAAPSQQLSGQAAAAAAGLGVPLLVAEAGNEQQVAAELDRLEAGTVVTYGGPAPDWTAVTGERPRVSGPATAEGFRSVLGLEAAPAGPGPAVAQIAAMETGSPLAVPGLEVPVPQAAPQAAPAPGTASGTAAAGEELPAFEAAPEPANALVLATEDPASAAAVATARAAGAEVRMVATADPRADAAVIALLRSHRDGAIYAAGTAFGGSENFAAQTAVALYAPELPGGGQTVFPGRRMVALYGHPSGGGLGVLGEQGLDATIQLAKDTAAQYQPYSAEPVVPALEIISTVASSEAGDDGNFSAETPVEELRPWVEAAGEAGVYVVLDLQPGLSTFLDQAVRYEELLKLPHVGLALDAEWRITPGQRHLEQIGSVDAAEVNAVSVWLADLTRTSVLPQKVFMLHQFNLSMIRNRGLLDVSHPELAVSLHADGHGTPDQKQDTWNVLRSGLQPEIWPGWKNFYDEDTPMLTPEQTFTEVSPKPWFISYQ